MAPPPARATGRAAVEERFLHHHHQSPPPPRHATSSFFDASSAAMSPSTYRPVVMMDAVDAIDENLLLAETEELLAALDATAFISSPMSTEEDEDEEEDGEYDNESLSGESEPLKPKGEFKLESNENGRSATSNAVAAMATTPKNAATTIASESTKMVVAAPKAGGGTGKKRIRSRDRTKDELIELRRSVVEMEKHLVTLRRNTTVMGKGRETIAKTWEHIAKRQLRDRQRAEAENQNLKAMLLGQLSLAGRFDQTSNKRQLVALPDIPLSPFATQTKRARVVSDNSDTMEELIDDLDRLFSKMESVFEECEIDQWQNETKSYAEVKTKVDSDTGEDSSYIELVDVRMIPFRVQAVGNYLWESMKSWHHKNNAYAYPCQDRPEDTFAVRYRVKSNSEEDKYSATFKLVKRRYIKDNELVVIWRSRSDGESDLSGYYTDEMGWVAVSHVPPMDETSQPMTALRACLHIHPRKTGDLPLAIDAEILGDNDGGVSIGEGSKGSNEKILANLVMGSFEDDVNSINQTMENLLLEDARGVLNQQQIDKVESGMVKTMRIQFAASLSSSSSPAPSSSSQE